MPGPKPKPIIERFESKVELIPFSTCHHWVGATNPKGYGNFLVDRKIEKAHRVAYMLYVGVIPDGMVICHKCDNPSCVNPDHLFLGTYQDNHDDMYRKGRDKHAVGENQGASKLSESDVIEIRSLSLTQRVIAKMYGISHSQVHRIKTLKDWKHVA